MAGITIMQVAKRAGVNAATVSRVLNGKIKEDRPAIAKRAERIRKLAREMGYRPSSAARSVAQGRCGQMAFVTCGFDWFPRGLLHGIHGQAESRNTRVIYSEVIAPGFADPSYVPRLLHESAVDGLLVHLNPTFTEHALPFFDAERLPTVVLNMKRPMNSVYADDVQGGYLATSTLLKKGHRRIGFFRRSGPYVHYSSEDRWQGYANAMQEARLAYQSLPQEPEVAYGQLTPRCTLEMAESYLSSNRRLTAVVCYEVQEAVLLKEAAMRLGLEGSKSPAVVCFSEENARFLSGMAIPTAVVPFPAIGVAATNMLLDLIDADQRHTPSRAIPYTGVTE